MERRRVQERNIPVRVRAPLRARTATEPLGPKDEIDNPGVGGPEPLLRDRKSVV